MENLAQLETLCGRLYESQDSAERAYVENTLGCFSRDSNNIPQLQYILENARNPYAVIYASSSLLKHVTENTLSLQLRIQIRNLAINYLAARGAELEHFTMISVIQLLSRVTKVSWFDDDIFREIVRDTMTFFNQEAKHYAVGLKVLNQLVSEMNQKTAELSSVDHRKVSSKFRDEALLQIFEISLTSLHGLKNDAQPKLQELALSLSLQCLSFDFAGMSVDESSDDVGSIQLSAYWKPIIEEPSTVNIYFEYYAATNPPLTKLSLQCLTLLVSVRRSLFTSNVSRMQFVNSLMMGTKDILEKGRGLNDHDNYHEFCRLLGRFKIHYQMSEMMSMEGYNAWICLVSDFTLKSLKSWKWASSSVFYLLGLWSRMVQALPHLKGDFPGIVRLDELVPKILEGFVSSRFESLQTEFPDDLVEDPLDKIDVIQDQLDFYPHLCRFQYGSCSTHLMNVLDPILQEYMEGVTQLDHLTTSNIGVLEIKLAWMVHIIAAILRIKGISSGPNEIIDAELSARVLRLINAMDSGAYVQRYGELSRQRLELAVLSFFQSFRKTCIGDQTIHSSKLYVRLSELLGLHDHHLVLDVMVRKVATNLKCFSEESEEVLDQTLTFFLELASGYMTSKLLLKLEALQYITANHNRHFRFLEDYRCRKRTKFYCIIGSLVFMEDSIIKFRQSMDPFLQVLVNLESTSDHVFRSDTVKCALAGLMRDLRGIAMAANSRRTYGFLFDWLYPAHMPLLLRTIATWADAPEVMNPLLKLVAELVLNKSQRLAFDQSSVNGILLFREVSKVLVAYGSRILNISSQGDVYSAKYKGVWVSLVVLSRAIDGNYVNFGVFELYGDRALADALDITLKMILSIPSEHMLSYRKVTEAYFSFMAIILEKYIRFALDLDASTFEYVVRSLLSGLKVLGSNLVPKCAAAIDHLATFYFDHILMKESPPTPSILNFANQVAKCADVLHEILKTLFEIFLFEDTCNQWGLGKAMLSLILLSEEMYTKLKTQILTSQPADKQQHLLHCFDNLMGDITRSLDTKNREKFVQNLRRFKKEFQGK
ncbi:uncharacterized protein LOC141657333 isoform X2 [Silene latifolia]|uniref:uncharacterized protein LOC141657333 isoform X2 n=1 Tax=Silene latifolia TaxID=37657 RepID=UPI003D7719DF